jgi:hypothetical protein
MNTTKSKKQTVKYTPFIAQVEQVLEGTTFEDGKLDLLRADRAHYVGLNISKPQKGVVVLTVTFTELRLPKRSNRTHAEPYRQAGA